jgi:hypothetical protein
MNNWMKRNGEHLMDDTTPPTRTISGVPSGGGAQDKIRVTVYLTPEVRDSLRRIAYEEDVPLTRAISRVIDEGLKARSEAAAGGEEL